MQNVLCSAGHLSNLLANALHYTPGGSRMTAAAHPTDDGTRKGRCNDSCLATPAPLVAAAFRDILHTTTRRINSGLKQRNGMSTRGQPHCKNKNGESGGDRGVAHDHGKMI